MKIVEVGEVYDETPPGQEKWTTRTLGWLVALALALLALLGFWLGNLIGDGRIALIVAREGGLVSWHADGLWTMVGFITLLIPFVIVPGVFGVRTRQILPPMPRHRWKVVLGLAAAQTIALGAFGMFAGQDGGFATARDAAWFSNGKVVQRTPLTAAEVVRTRCVMRYDKGDDRKLPPTRPMLDYTVDFGHGRYARADWGVNRASATLVPWIQRMTLIDAAFRAAGVRREAEVDQACLLAVMDGDPVAAEALGRLMR